MRGWEASEEKEGGKKRKEGRNKEINKVKMCLSRKQRKTDKKNIDAMYSVRTRTCTCI